MPGPKYVSDFSFPSDAGFSGSAGVQHVNGYARGGHVKKADGGALSDADKAYLDRSSSAMLRKAQSPARDNLPGALSDADKAYLDRSSSAMLRKAQSPARDNLPGALSDADKARLGKARGGKVSKSGPTPPSLGVKKKGRATGPDFAARARTPGGLKEGGKASDAAQDKKAISAAVHKHEKAAHPGKPLTKLRRGGVPSYRSSPLIGD